MSNEWRAIVMKLYHGSDVEIENIDLSYSQINKDFGKGFLVT